MQYNQYGWYGMACIPFGEFPILFLASSHDTARNLVLHGPGYGAVLLNLDLFVSFIERNLGTIPVPYRYYMM